MAYAPGTLHVMRLMPNGDPAPIGSRVEVVPSSERIKDPSDGTVVLSGIVVEDLVAGEASIALPPSTGMDPDPVTYDVRVHIKGYMPEEWVTGVEIVAGEVTELAAWTSVVPGPAVPNVQAELVELVAQGAGSAEAAGDSETAAGQSAAAALGSQSAAAQSAVDADGDRQAAQSAAGTASTKAGEASGSAATATGAAGTATTKAAEAVAARDQAVAAAIVGAAVAEAPPASLTAAMLGSTRTWVLSANYTLPGLPNPPAGSAGLLTLVLKQPATGGPYAVNLGSVPEWAGDALAPVMPTVANSELVLQLMWTGTVWRAFNGGTFFP